MCYRRSGYELSLGGRYLFGPIWALSLECSHATDRLAWSGGPTRLLSSTAVIAGIDVILLPLNLLEN